MKDDDDGCALHKVVRSIYSLMQRNNGCLSECHMWWQRTRVHHKPEAVYSQRGCNLKAFNDIWDGNVVRQVLGFAISAGVY